MNLSFAIVLLILDFIWINIFMINPYKYLVNYIDLFGNTVSSSIPIALSKLFSENSNLGKNLLISGFGVGLSCGSTVLFNKGEFKNE